MKYRFVFAAVMFAFVIDAAPASAAANKEHLQLMAEIRMLQEQQQGLQALLGTLQDTLKALNQKLDDQAGTERKAEADQTLALSNIRDTVRMLREKTDETNVRISSVSQDIEALRQSIAAQPQGASPASAGAPTGAGAPPTGTTPPTGAGSVANPSATQPANAAPVPPAGVSPQQMYDSSFQDYASARYDLAIEGFNLFISTFPKFPLAAQAQYNIGQSYYAEKKYQDARDNYLKVIQNYPQQTEWVADAYYKLGQTYEQLNQIDEAKKAYQTVLDKYPTSDAFNLAKQALDRLNRG